MRGKERAPVSDRSDCPHHLKWRDLETVLADSGMISTSQPPRVAVKIREFPFRARDSSRLFIRPVDARFLIQAEELGILLEFLDTESLLAFKSAADFIKIDIGRDGDSFHPVCPAGHAPVFEYGFLFRKIWVWDGDGAGGKNFFVRVDDSFGKRGQGKERFDYGSRRIKPGDIPFQKCFALIGKVALYGRLVFSQRQDLGVIFRKTSGGDDLAVLEVHHDARASAESIVVRVVFNEGEQFFLNSGIDGSYHVRSLLGRVDDIFGISFSARVRFYYFCPVFTGQDVIVLFFQAVEALEFSLPVKALIVLGGIAYVAQKMRKARRNIGTGGHGREIVRLFVPGELLLVSVIDYAAVGEDDYFFQDIVLAPVEIRFTFTDLKIHQSGAEDAGKKKEQDAQREDSILRNSFFYPALELLAVEIFQVLGVEEYLVRLDESIAPPVVFFKNSPDH